MDLRNSTDKTIIPGLKKCIAGYQPFIVDDDFQTGVAANWLDDSQPTVMSRAAATPAAWENFTSINARMRTMYDGWVDHIWRHVGDVPQPTAMDVACSDGYFLYRMLEKGATRAIGYDRDHSRGTAIDLLNKITGQNVEFRQKHYDSEQHILPGAEPADIVIASAIMVHLSDPLHFLACLGKLTKHVLFLYAHIDDVPDLRITYRGKIRKYYDDSFPNCFNADTRISRALLEVTARELGFSEIITVMHQPGWMPVEWYRRQSVLILRK